MWNTLYQIFVSPLHRLTDWLQILMSIRDYGSCLSPLHLVIPTLFLNASIEKIYVHSFIKPLHLPPSPLNSTPPFPSFPFPPLRLFLPLLLLLLVLLLFPILLVFALILLFSLLLLFPLLLLVPLILLFPLLLSVWQMGKVMHAYSIPFKRMRCKDAVIQFY